MDARVVAAGLARRSRAPCGALAVAVAVVLLATDALAQAIAPPTPQPPPPTFLHDQLGLPDNITLRATVRVRPEFMDRQFRPAPAPIGDRLLAIQTLVYADYRNGPFLIGGELMDSRVYFATPLSTYGTGEVNTLEPGQAFVSADLKALANLPGVLTAGRFTMEIGSRRLVARNNFRNAINTFTGLRYDAVGFNNDTFRLFYTLPDYRLPDEQEAIRANKPEIDRPSPDLQFFGGAYLKQGVFGGSMQLQSYGLTERDSLDLPTRNRNLFTPAIRFARGATPGHFTHDFEAVYQTGRSRLSTSATDTTDRTVSAYLFHGEFGYMFDVPWHPVIAAVYDHASGNRAGASRVQRFDTLFGARRWEFGPSSIYGAVQRSNLISPGFHFDLFPSDRFNSIITYRGLFLESATDAFSTTQIVDPTGRSGRYAGQQLDVRLRYSLVPKFVTVDTGVEYLIKGNFLRNAPNVQDKQNVTFVYSAMSFNF